MAPNRGFNLETCCRPNILALEPYRCARDDYKDDGTNVLLDANENAYGPGLHLDQTGKLTPTHNTPLLNGTDSDDLTLKTSVTINDFNSSGDLAILDNTTNNSSAHPHPPTLTLSSLNRYPDPHQEHLKSLFCNLRQDPLHRHPGAPPLTPDNLFVGVGSDEAIDSLIRCFCTPGRDRILICPPTYGMYTVSAHVNDVGITRVPLLPRRPAAGQNPEEVDDFALDIEGIEKTIADDAARFEEDEGNGRIKLVFLCTPGNPTGAFISKANVERILQNEKLNGLVVLDEAYIDFASSQPSNTSSRSHPQQNGHTNGSSPISTSTNGDSSPPTASPSLAPLTTSHPNLAVLQTLSKAFGLAGIRLGICITSPPIARIMNSMKAPYNISEVTSQLACQALQPGNLGVMARYRERLVRGRERLIRELPRVRGIGRFRGGFSANFLLVEVLGGPEEEGGKPSNAHALRVYQALASEEGMVVRFRGKEHGCEGCLRVTVGTEGECERFLGGLRRVLERVYEEDRRDRGARDGGDEGGLEKVAREEEEVVT